MERAVEWIFANIGNIDQIERDEEQRARAASVAAASTTPQVYRDGSSMYQLFAMVSHMGQSTLCGHYVAHIRKDITPDVAVVNSLPKNPNAPTAGSQSPASQAPPSPTQSISGSKWTIFNDSKVAISEKPPIPFAYLYIYKRVTE